MKLEAEEGTETLCVWVSEWVSVCERERERERERKQRKPEAVFSLFLIGTSHSAFRLRPPFGPYNGAVRAGQRRVAVWSVAGMDFGRRRRRRPRRWLHSLLFIPLAIFDLRRNRIMRSVVIIIIIIIIIMEVVVGLSLILILRIMQSRRGNSD